MVSCGPSERNSADGSSSAKLRWPPREVLQLGEIDGREIEKEAWTHRRRVDGGARRRRVAAAAAVRLAPPPLARPLRWRGSVCARASVRESEEMGGALGGEREDGGAFFAGHSCRCRVISEMDSHLGVHGPIHYFPLWPWKARTCSTTAQVVYGVKFLWRGSSIVT